MRHRATPFALKPPKCIVGRGPVAASPKGAKVIRLVLTTICSNVIGGYFFFGLELKNGDVGLPEGVVF